MCLFGGAPSGGGARIESPPPTPEPPKEPATYVDPAVREARNNAKRTAIGRQGYASTNATSPLGVPDLANTSKMVLGA